MSSRTEAAPSRQLALFLARARRRLARRRAAEAALASLPWSVGLASLLVLSLRGAAAREWIALAPHAAEAWAAALVGGAALVAALLQGLRRFDAREIALLVDRALATRERFSTAAWSSHEEDAEARAAAALESLGGRRPAEAIPARRRPWRGTAIALVALAAAWLAPLPGPAEAPPPPEADPEVQAIAKRVEQDVEELAEELREKTPPGSVDELLEEVRREAAHLGEEPVGRDQAGLTLQALEQRLQRERDERQAADSGALQRALSAMEQAALTRHAARAAQRGDAASFEQELARLAEAFQQGVSFDEREIDRLSVRMEEAAAELAESSHGELARSLEEIARALAEGDLERAAELLEALRESGALEQAAHDAAADRALEQTQALLQQALAQMGQAQPDALGPSAAREAAELLREAAEALEAAGPPPGEDGDGGSEGEGAGDPAAEAADDLRDIAGLLDEGALAEAASSAEGLLSSGSLREPMGSQQGDAAAREAERLLAEALAAIRRALEGGTAGTAPGPRSRTGFAAIPEDWGVGTTNEAAASFRTPTGGHQSDRQSDETSEWIEAYEALYDSTRLDEAKGRSTRVRGQVGEGEHVAVPVWSTAPGPGQARLPQVKLPPSYAQASEEALARETIPAGYAESVRRYFDSLGGAKPPEPEGDEP